MAARDQAQVSVSRTHTEESPDGWTAQAACRSHKRPDWWFPPSEKITHEIVQAKLICARCPVRQDCLDHAVEHQERFGIWGGYLPWERRGL